MNIENKVICLNRFLGRCKDCSEDYNVNHHPNNYDCRDYKELRIVIFEVKKQENL